MGFYSFLAQLLYFFPLVVKYIAGVLLSAIPPYAFGANSAQQAPLSLLVANHCACPVRLAAITSRQQFFSPDTPLGKLRFASTFCPYTPVLSIPRRLFCSLYSVYTIRPAHGLRTGTVLSSLRVGLPVWSVGMPKSFFCCKLVAYYTPISFQ